jgi:hypothetical protein
MPRYKNIGSSPWRRPNGEAVPPGGIFNATVRELQRIQRRPQYRQRLSLVAEPKATAPRVDPVVLQAAWPCRMEPKLYLKLHPKGQHAELAREICAAAPKEEQ